MTVKSFLVSILILSCITLSVCQDNLESLKQALTETKDDSVKVNLLIRLSATTKNSDFAQASKYANEALKIAEEKDWDWARAEAYDNLGFVANSVGNFVQSLEYNNKALRLELLTNDSVDIATSYNNLGNDYFELGEYEEAYFYVEKSYELSNAAANKLGSAIALHNLARIYARLGKLKLALSHFESSAKLSEEAKDDEAPVYNNLEIGNAYLLNNDYKSAQKYYREAALQNKSMGIIHQTPKIQLGLANAFLMAKDYNTALKYYDSTIQSNKAINNIFGEAEANLGKSKVFLAKKSYKDAIAIANSSLQTAQNLRAQRLIYDCYQLIAKCEEEQGEFKSALSHIRQAQQVRDSLTNVDMMSQVFENEYQMRSQKKDQEIESLRKLREQSMSEIKRQQFIRNIFAVVFALTIVLLYSVYKSGRRKVEINDLLMKHQEETDKRTKELEELNKVKDKFFSIISHDLRSPINSLAGLLDLMEKDQIKAEELPALTKEMRAQFNHTKNLINNLLDWTLLQMNKVAIKKEKLSIKTIIDENIKLLSTMSTKQTTFQNEVGDDIFATADNNMINLIFRNLILNGIKFSDNGGTIKIKASKTNNDITVSVSDNGVGISEDVQKMLFEKTTGYSTRGTANEKGTGLGLILCKEFIERNGGKIWLESEIGKGSTFYVTIPS